MLRKIDDCSKVGFVASCFELGPHAGHLTMLREARQNCDYLVVALHVDPSAERPQKNKPSQPVSERYLQLASCKYVDEIIPYETEAELINIILLVMPHIRFLGSDYEGKPFTGDKLDIPIHFCKRNHTVSSSGLRKKVYELEAVKKQ